MPVRRRGHRVVQEMRAELVPRPVDVVGDEHRRRLSRVGDLDEARLVPRLPARLLVGLDEAGVGAWAIRPRPNRPARRAAARLPPPMKNFGPPLVGRGRDPRSTVAPCLVDARAEQRRQLLVGSRAAAAQVEAEVLVLLLAVADAEDVRHPPAADDVEHGDVLGEADRLVERQHDARRP